MLDIGTFLSKRTETFYLLNNFAYKFQAFQSLLLQKKKINSTKNKGTRRKLSKRLKRRGRRRFQDRKKRVYMTRSELKAYQKHASMDARIEMLGTGSHHSCVHFLFRFFQEESKMRDRYGHRCRTFTCKNVVSASQNREDVHS